MNKICFLLILSALLLFVWMIQAQDKQTGESQTNSEAQKEKRVKKYDQPISTQDAFLRILLEEKKPGGLALLNNSCVSEEIKSQTERENASLETALSSIVRQDSLYAWSIEKGIVNLLPTNNEPDFLKIQIKEFRLDGDLSSQEALEKLLQLPELKSKAAEINLNRGLSFLGLTSPRNTKSRLVFELKNVTVREALNELVRRDGKAVWRYSESNCNGKINSSLELVVR